MQKIIWTTQKNRYGDLVASDYNPRQITDKQNSDLRKSLEKFGVVEIPVINKDGKLIAGHQRVRLSIDLYGLDYEDDVRIPDRQLTKQEEKEYNIRSNKNTGEWNWDLLANGFEVDDLLDWGFEKFELGIPDSLESDNESELNLNDLSDSKYNIIFTFDDESKYLNLFEKIKEVEKSSGKLKEEKLLEDYGFYL